MTEARGCSLCSSFCFVPASEISMETWTVGRMHRQSQGSIAFAEDVGGGWDGGRDGTESRDGEGWA